MGDANSKASLEAFECVYIVDDIAFSLGQGLSDNMAACSAEQRHGHGCIPGNAQRRGSALGQEGGQVYSQGCTKPHTVFEGTRDTGCAACGCAHD